MLESPTEDSSGIKVEQIDLNGGQLEYINDRLDHTGIFTVAADWSHGDSTLNASFDLKGDVNYSSAIFAGSVKADLSGTQDGPVGSFGIEGQLAKLNLRMTGTASNIRTLAESDVELELQGQELKALLENLSLAHAEISEIKLKTFIHYGAEDELDGSFNLSLDNSNAGGQFIVEVLQDIDNDRQVTGSVIAKSVYMDAILGSDNANQVQNSTSKVEAPERTEYFSVSPFTRLHALDGTDVDLNVSVDELYKGELRVNDLQLSLKKSGNHSQVVFSSDDFAKGFINGSISLVNSELGMQGKISTQAKRVRIGEIMSLADLPEGAVSGKFSGDAKFWVNGNSMAELVSSLDGGRGLFMLIEEGKLDSLLVEMAGIDFMESISLAMKRDLQQTEMRCGYVDIPIQPTSNAVGRDAWAAEMPRLLCDRPLGLVQL